MNNINIKKNSCQVLLRILCSTSSAQQASKIVARAASTPTTATSGSTSRPSSTASTNACYHDYGNIISSRPNLPRRLVPAGINVYSCTTHHASQNCHSLAQTLSHRFLSTLELKCASFRSVFQTRLASRSTCILSSRLHKKSEHGDSNKHKGRNGQAVPPLLLLAFSLPFTKKKDDDEQVDPVVMTLKRGVLATQKQEYEEARELFHRALEMVNDQHRKQIIDNNQHVVMRVNIFGLMADTAMKSSDHKNAEKLYKEMMKLCVASGKANDDPAMVELSIKLASLYAMQSRDEEAETGFKFCLEATQKALDKAGGILEADTNLLALHGLSCQSYARFLMKRKQSKKAIELYASSLDVAREVYGSDHPQTLVVLNEIASAHVICGKYAEGIRYYKEAVDRASSMEDMDDSLVAFHYNIGEAYIIAKDFELAKHHCEQCLSFAKKVSNPALIRMAKQCISDVSSVQKKEKR